MAEQYLQEILTIQPTGPYLLGGFCMGGTVAFEIAQQLRTRKQEVAMLIMMETYNWSNMPDRSIIDKIYYYLQKIQFNWGRLFSGEHNFIKRRKDLIKEKMALLIETARSGGFRLRKENGYHSLLYLLEEINNKAGNEYEPKGTYPWPMVNIVPAKEYRENTRPELNWDKISATGIELYKLPLYPRQMLSEPFAPLLVEKISYSIEAAAGQLSRQAKNSRR
jgi:thioesterase domain-containing protein